MAILEVVAVIVSITAVVLTMHRQLYCWLFNFLAYLLYAVVFFQFKLYGETLLQLLFMMMAIYGYLSWQQDIERQQPITIRYNPPLNYIFQVIAIFLFGIILGSFLSYFTDAAVPWLDAQLVAFSLLATYWSTQKYLQTWLLWIIIDIIYVVMFIYKTLYLTAGLYIVFIFLAFAGWQQWKKTGLQSRRAIQGV